MTVCNRPRIDCNRNRIATVASDCSATSESSAQLVLFADTLTHRHTRANLHWLLAQREKSGNNNGIHNSLYLAGATLQSLSSPLERASFAYMQNNGRVHARDTGRATNHLARLSEPVRPRVSAQMCPALIIGPLRPDAASVALLFLSFHRRPVRKPSDRFAPNRP